MEERTLTPFLQFWNNAMWVGSVIMFVAGIALYILHKIRVAAISDYKAKYDYLNTREIKTYKLVFLCLAIAVLLFINLYGANKLDEMGVWFFVRLFISVAGGTLVGYVAYLIMDYYYPTILSRKLKKWRYKPRISATGNEMRLLSEEEEDVHLEEGMQAEENAFSFDYDVWVDEASAEVRIEKYNGHLEALKCNSCGFYTMRLLREEIVTPATVSSPGELIKHYQCSYCKSVRATAFNISNKTVDDYNLTTLKSEFKKNKNIDLVRVEIHSNTSGKKFFEFQNTDQAQKFLREYEDKG
ncbi:MAG TPA: hypothetical protein VKZ75_11685 [Cyclobacteriaceae bacterium]|nr:hypothetical protein [Cyclobacteriaceae bacterium]